MLALTATAVMNNSTDSGEWSDHARESLKLVRKSKFNQETTSHQLDRFENLKAGVLGKPTNSASAQSNRRRLMQDT